MKKHSICIIELKYTYFLKWQVYTWTAKLLGTIN